MLREGGRDQSRPEAKVVRDVILIRVNRLSKRVDEAGNLYQELTQKQKAFFDGMHPSSFAPDGRPKYRVSREQYNEWVDLAEAQKKAYRDYLSAINAFSKENDLLFRAFDDIIVSVNPQHKGVTNHD